MITPYGYDNAFLMLGVGACLVLLGVSLGGPIVAVLLGTLGVLLICFTLWFFRDPDRPLHPDAARDHSVLVAPADGTVMEIVPLSAEQCAANDDLRGLPRGIGHVQISIFLSPLNVHVNRYPMSGEIVEARYLPGKYLMAFDPKSSTDNERSIFICKNGAGSVLYKQITGFLARRIVYDTKQGDVATAGDRFGMMKFGSRMDIVVPDTAEILVKSGQKTIGCGTLIARLKGAQN